MGGEWWVGGTILWALQVIVKALCWNVKDSLVCKIFCACYRASVLG